LQEAAYGFQALVERIRLGGWEIEGGESHRAGGRTGRKRREHGQGHGSDQQGEFRLGRREVGFAVFGADGRASEGQGKGRDEDVGFSHADTNARHVGIRYAPD
jgi:hypothetical protein